VADYVERYIDTVLDEVFPDLAAVMLTGPRACGKTTTAARRAASILRLDDEQRAQAFAAAPDALLAAQDLPTLVDEWQEVPASLGAIKRAVDSGSGGGRFLITGSVRARRTEAVWPGTGRVVPFRMHSLARGEIEASPDAADFLQRLFSDEDPLPTIRRSAPTVVDYVEHAVQGGFPETLGLSERARDSWYPGYVDQLVHRDVAALADVRSPDRLAALLHAVALSTAGVPQTKTLTEAVGIDSRTVNAYLDLLDDLRIIERVPAWSSNRLKRLVRAPKLYVADTGLATSLLRADKTAIVSSGDLLGRIIDTFVAAQILPLVALSHPRIEAFHLRDSNGSHEIDLLLEGPGGAVVGIEIKAANAVKPQAARHLEWLRDSLGNSFKRGIVFHTGDTTYPMGDRIWAMPIAAIWR
jgi:predicted AAA+ superfamily ATPase